MSSGSREVRLARLPASTGRPKASSPIAKYRAGGAMIRAERCLSLAVAPIAAPLLLLAGCAALGVDSAKVASIPLPSRPRLVGGSIEQLRYGKDAPFQVCAGNTCPKPTRKTLAGATPRSDADTTGMLTAPPRIAAP